MSSKTCASQYYQHETAIVETNSVGDDSRIWAHVHILNGAVIGSDCNICDHVFIENDVIVGNRVTIKCGVQLWDGVRLADDVFVGPNATFTNDLFPRSKKLLESFLPTFVDKGASIGANSTLLAGIRVGEGAMVGAGAVVTRDVPPYAVVAGNPAQIVRYINAKGTQSTRYHLEAGRLTEPKDLPVMGCKLWPLPNFSDMRGDLMAIELDSNLPFDSKRCFFVHSVPNQRVRGEHAHVECSQFLIAIYGSLYVVLDDTVNRSEILLDKPDFGLFIPPGIWGTQYKFSRDAVLCVFASHPYDSDDYIREYSKYLGIKRRD
jgi:UDP-2-acetamido-3-amino-2,3-dideoxy-glucuronate N-acetyltransferase